MRMLIQQRSAPRLAAVRRATPTLALAAGLLLVLVAGHPSAWGAFFPSTDPVQFFFDDFEVDRLAADYTVYQWPATGWTADWWDQETLGSVDDAKGGVWGSRMVREGQAWLGRRTVLVIDGSGSDATRWTNMEIQVDISPVGNEEAGVAFGLHDDDSDGAIDRGYVVYFDQFPTAAQARNGARARWHLVRLTDSTWSPGDEVGGGFVELDTGSSYAADRTMVGEGSHVYRVRVRTFCSNLQVQVQRVYNPVGTSASFRGCGSSCPSASPDCWCTVTEWLEGGTSLTPGMAGLFAGGTENLSVNHRFDNLAVAAWEESCYQVCDDWLGWSATTAAGGGWDLYDSATSGEKVETLEFKHLYDAVLQDYAKVAVDFDGRIDNDVSHDAEQACEGWSLAVDLPDPADDGEGLNVSDLQAFLEPMATAVDLVDHQTPGSCGDGVLGNADLCFEDAFDTDPGSATYNPVPVISYGSTPIAASLEDAYEWYKSKRGEGGSWRNDSMAACRSWYVILITDGEEQCPLDSPVPDYEAACDAAMKFADPAAQGDPELDPVKIFTVGFAGGFTTGGESPVKCVSDNTGGEFRTAADATELSNVLYDVINRLEERNRSFSPFKVAPPASAMGGYHETRDYLAVFPFFVPRKERSLWEGSLYAFRLNKDVPTLPATDDCQIDFSQALWDAGAVLKQQVLDSTTADPKREVFMGLESGGVWSRYDLADIKAGGNDTLRTAFASLLNPASPASSLEVQEVVNFLRYMWEDDDTSTTPDPRWPDVSGLYPGGRPVDDLGGPLQEIWPALGDVYHSQPVLVNPPNTSMYYYDYGFGSAHGYPDFMVRQSKRRRVALAGANDGMLHAFDAGFYNRDTTDYADQHDLGNGTELFAYVPHAVFDKLHNLVNVPQQDYLVDGQITVADAFIAPAADADREWRTVALATMRRGGRGLVALDITQPDPLDGDGTPTASVLPGCLAGSGSGGTTCSGAYPKVLWEFEDTSDWDSNTKPDLGWTWSKPAVARIAVYNSSSADQPDDVFVAFFGGGWDMDEDEDDGTNYTGLYVYGVNIETGEILVKHNIGVAVPGSFTALDSDLDGYHDRIYFGDSDGGLWRISYPKPNSSASTGPELTSDGGGGTLTKIYDLSAANLAGGMELRQRFFARPVTVPVGFAGRGFQWALAIGSGDRADLGDRSAVVDGSSNQVNAFYFVMDVDDTTRGVSNLTEHSYADLNGDYECSDGSDLDPDNGRYGWYLTLRANEKVNFEATVINGHVVFPTFEATDDTVDGPPDMCGTEPADRPEDTDNLCTAFGIGRMYNLWFKCGQGEETALNDVITGVEDYTINGITYVTGTLSEASPGPTEEFVNSTGYSATNWRQD